MYQYYIKESHVALTFENIVCNNFKFTIFILSVNTINIILNEMASDAQNLTFFNTIILNNCPY